MKKTDSNKIVGIVTLVVLVALFAYMGYQNRRINRLQNENQLKAIELSSLRDTIAVYQSKNGDLTYKLSAIEVSRSNLKESLELAGFEIKKLKERDINWREVTNALKLELEAAGQGETALTDSFYVFKTDTVQYSTFGWTNDFLAFSGSVQDERLFFDYNYKTGISIIQEPRRQETVVSVFLTDPQAAITTANSITVKHKQKIFQRGWVWAVIGFTGGILLTK